MGYLKCALAVWLVGLAPSVVLGALTVAYDDASDPVYSPGPYHTLNGGFGFNPWQHTDGAADHSRLRWDQFPQRTRRAEH